jgi:D-alanyl-D-alanine carboxypeptidase (penicillin-binding protein 4)
MPKNYAVGADTISTVYSPNITKIINITNRTSNNLYAETLFKTIGKVMTGTGSMDSSAVAVTRFLKAKGINTSGLRVEDGSGLSRLNYISAKTLTEFLALMQREKCFDEFF